MLQRYGKITYDVVFNLKIILLVFFEKLIN